MDESSPNPDQSTGSFCLKLFDLQCILLGGTAGHRARTDSSGPRANRSGRLPAYDLSERVHATSQVHVKHICGARDLSAILAVVAPTIVFEMIFTLAKLSGN